MNEHSRAEAELYVLKIGGSVLTEKGAERRARKGTIKRISGEIALALSTAHKKLIIAHECVKELNRMVVSSLMEFGLNAMPIHPLSVVVTKGGELKYKIKEQIEMALNMGIIPVLHGDVILDAEGGFRILSGDQLVVYVAKEFKAGRVGVGTDVSGVLNDAGEVIRKITPAEVEEMSIEVFRMKR